MSALDKMGTLAEVVINDKTYSGSRSPMYKLTDAIESQIASTSSADYTHLSNSTTSFNNDISSLENLRNANTNSLQTKKSKSFVLLVIWLLLLFIYTKNFIYVFAEAWDVMEDELLTSLVDRFGTQTWTEIALRLQNRSGKQCRERWHNHLDPSIRKVSEMYIYIMYV